MDSGDAPVLELADLSKTYRSRGGGVKAVSHVSLSVGAGRTHEEVARFSPRDAERLDAYAERLEAIAEVLRELVLQTPPNVVVEAEEPKREPSLRQRG